MSFLPRNCTTMLPSIGALALVRSWHTSPGGRYPIGTAILFLCPMKNRLHSNPHQQRLHSVSVLGCLCNRFVFCYYAKTFVLKSNCSTRYVCLSRAMPFSVAICSAVIFYRWTDIFGFSTLLSFMQSKNQNIQNRPCDTVDCKDDNIFYRCPHIFTG